MNRKFVFSPGEFYHVWSRGVDRRDVFKSDEDRGNFLNLLYVSNATNRIQLSLLPKNLDPLDIPREETLADIGSYSLLTNHLHLLVKEKNEGGISAFLQKLLTAHSMFFNKKYGRSGPLFVRPFGAEHSNNDVYLRYLFAYVNLNPISVAVPKWKEGINNAQFARIKEFLRKYKYSSYFDLCGNGRKAGKILNLKVFPEYFSSGVEFETLLDDYLKFNLNNLKASPFKGVAFG